METIGQRLFRLRKERGISQRQLAIAAQEFLPPHPGRKNGSTRRGTIGGVTYAYVSRIEAGHRLPSVHAIRALAVVLDVSAHYLETGEPDPFDLLATHVFYLLEKYPHLRLDRDGRKAAQLIGLPEPDSGETMRILFGDEVVDELDKVIAANS